MKIKVQDIAVKAGGVVAGVAAAKLVNKFLPGLNPKIRGAAKILIGAIAPALVPKLKIADHVGSGFMAMGASELMDEFVPGISGADDVLSGPEEAVVIDEDYEQVSGVENETDIMAGFEDEEEDNNY